MSSSSSSPSSSKRLKIDFGAMTENNIELLRKLNTACFPISYNDGFYKDVVAASSNKNNNNNSSTTSNNNNNNIMNQYKHSGEALNKFAYHCGYVIGALCARIETLPKDQDEEEKRIYIMTLGVLAAYRGRQVGTQLVESLLEYWEQYKDIDPDLQNVTEIALHVQISNQDAIRFYTHRFGFTQGDLVENYYRRIDPPHCYLLYKKLR